MYDGYIIKKSQVYLVPIKNQNIPQYQPKPQQIRHRLTPVVSMFEPLRLGWSVRLLDRFMSDLSTPLRPAGQSVPHHLTAPWPSDALRNPPEVRRFRLFSVPLVPPITSVAVGRFETYVARVHFNATGWRRRRLSDLLAVDGRVR